MVLKAKTTRALTQDIKLMGYSHTTSNTQSKEDGWNKKLGFLELPNQLAWYLWKPPPFCRTIQQCKHAMSSLWNSIPRGRFAHHVSTWSPKCSPHVRIHSSWPDGWVASRNSPAPPGSLLSMFGVPVVSLMYSWNLLESSSLQFNAEPVLNLEKFSPNRQMLTLLKLAINKAEFQSSFMSLKRHKGSYPSVILFSPFFLSPHTLSRDTCLSISLPSKHFPVLSCTQIIYVAFTNIFTLSCYWQLQGQRKPIQHQSILANHTYKSTIFPPRTMEGYCFLFPSLFIDSYYSYGYSIIFYCDALPKSIRKWYFLWEIKHI